MTKRQRPQIVIDVAGIVRTARMACAMTQRELSRRSGVSQSRISRIENLRTHDIALSEIDALLVALGVRYWLGTEAPRVTRSSRDLVHGWCAAYVTRRLVAAGWLVEREVEIGGDRWKGWIDVLAFHPATDVLLVIEVKTEIVDLGEIERTLNWYQRQAPVAARRFGWVAREVASSLLVLDTAANERLFSSNRDLLRLGFPGRARQLLGVVRTGTLADSGRCLALIDPRSRGSAWLRATGSDGRRSPTPYADYIDAARQMDSPAKAPR
jgi:transcriptional regulator with XRE-family HTH domain